MPDILNLSTLREEFSTIHAAAQGVIGLATTEKRDLTAEEKEAQTKRFARLDAIQTQVNDAKRLAAYNFSAGNVTLPTDPAGRKEAEAIEGAPNVTFNAANFPREEFSKSASDWFRTGQMAQKFATITTATQSGILLPTQVVTPLIPTAPNVFRQAFDLYGVPVTSTVSTAKYNQPVMSASAGSVVSETASSDSENAPSLTESIVSTVSTYQSGSTWFSEQDLAAVDFDLVNATLPALYYSKELALESAIAAAIIADSGITQTRQCTTATAITFADLTALNQKLPKRFQQRKVFVLSATAYAAAEGMIDSQNRPIMVPDAQNTDLKRLFGSPCLRSDYFDSLAASHVPGCVFSLLGFHLRDAGQGRVVRYVNVPTRPAQTGANMFAGHAFGYAASAVAKLTTGLS